MNSLMMTLTFIPLAYPSISLSNNFSIIHFYSSYPASFHSFYRIINILLATIKILLIILKFKDYSDGNLEIDRVMGEVHMKDDLVN